MKSGAGSPFDDDFDQEDETAAEPDSDTTQADTDLETNTSAEPADTTEQLPYKYRRDGVQDGRNHANLFLRDEAEAHVEDVVDAMDETFESESVYKIDVLEAIVLAANDDTRTVEDELRKMGYGMK
ncbi:MULTISPECIES: hypothetical protein [unclassified Haloarcula]|uniref:hypothetical protein n=1 Tax=Haloarcula TaxID=2237 RepID=UPI000EF21D8F|nr:MULTISPECIES: hypothetical protein [unclassified Haloarcula]RLM32771.1 hypothetical protein DVK01_19770 [Haloarcula sp. Atlit-120R]RLM41277.1 hypothetical protein DVK00_20510 [Haloarcula sp. Atlit-47R]